MKAIDIAPSEIENTRSFRVRRSSSGLSSRWSRIWRQTKQPMPRTPIARAAYAVVWSPTAPISLRP